MMPWPKWRSERSTTMCAKHAWARGFYRLILPAGFLQRKALEINALQRAATIIYQKSTREGFVLTVAEALWKGKPVIGGETGGIAVQLIPGVTGFTVNSPEGAAFYTRRLLNEPELMAALGRKGKEYIRHRFLITRHLQEYLALLTEENSEWLAGHDSDLIHRGRT